LSSTTFAIRGSSHAAAIAAWAEAAAQEISREEVEQVVAIAAGMIGMIGMPATVAVAVYTWVQNCFGRTGDDTSPDPADQPDRAKGAEEGGPRRGQLHAGRAGRRLRHPSVRTLVDGARRCR
jgi:hypothetical protein